MAKGRKGATMGKNKCKCHARAMTVMKFNKDYLSYNHINFDKPLMINEDGLSTKVNHLIISVESS